MEGCVWGWEQRTLINELTQGMALTKQLRCHLSSSTSSVETQDFLLEKILSSYEKALLVLKWSGPAAVHHPPPVESPLSFERSPQSDDMSSGFKTQRPESIVASKKRKTLPKRTDHVRVGSENGIEGTVEDGYSWRKYGQKDILGAKYPRSYYRCTYRHIQDCWATKLVQRSDEDPSIFEVTYKGTHTCSQESQPTPAPTLPEKNEQKQKHTYPMNFRANLSVNTEDLDNKDMMPPFSFPPSSFGSEKSQSQFFASPMPDNGNFTGTYSPPFISPATSESNYLEVSPSRMGSIKEVHNVHHHSESDPAEIFSANTSSANSPIIDLDFMLDPVDLGSFPFENSGFFS